jgi:hypothetical protein
MYIHQHTGASAMRTYKAFYKGKSCVVIAASSYDAQEQAAKFFGAKKSYQVAIVLADVAIDPAGL